MKVLHPAVAALSAVALPTPVSAQSFGVEEETLRSLPEIRIILPTDLDNDGLEDLV